MKIQKKTHQKTRKRRCCLQSFTAHVEKDDSAACSLQHTNYHLQMHLTNERSYFEGYLTFQLMSITITNISSSALPRPNSCPNSCPNQSPVFFQTLFMATCFMITLNPSHLHSLSVCQYRLCIIVIGIILIHGHRTSIDQ